MNRARITGRLRDRVSASIKAFHDPTGTTTALGHSLGSSFRTLGSGDYLDNAYADIVKAANGFAEIEPFFANNRHKPVNSPLLDAFYRPNTRMSASQFRKNLAINLLVHDKFYVILLDGETDFTKRLNSPAKVAGYDILTPRQVTLDIDGNVVAAVIGRHNMPVNPDRVLEISDVLDPRDLTKGYAAFRAMEPWAKLDDLNRRAQTKYYARGGTPNGQFNITTSSRDQYDTVKQSIIDSMADGGGNNEPIFSHTPIVNGKPGQPMVTWQQIQSSARDMTTGSIVDYIEKKLSSPIGVPDEVKGFLSNSNYASVIMAEWIFYDGVVKPLATAVYDKFTAELSNIFGDIGGAFEFESNRVQFADENNKNAQTDTINIQNIKTLTEMGYSIEGAIEILDLPSRYMAMADSKYQLDNYNVQNGDNTPESTTSMTTTPRQTKTAASNEDNPIYVPIKVNLDKYVRNIEKAAQKLQGKLVNDYLRNSQLKSSADELDEETNDDEILATVMTVWIVMAIMEAGDKRTGPGTKFLQKYGVDTEQINQYTAGDQRLARSVRAYRNNPTSGNLEKLVSNIQMTTSPVVIDLKDHLRTVARGYSDNIRRQITATVSDAVKKGLSPSELTKKLTALMDNQDARRLAESEVHRADGLQRIDQVKYWARRTGTTFVKGLRNTGNKPCEYCQALAGKWVDIDDPFVAVGDIIEGTLGGMRTNNYENIVAAHVHPYCECSEIFMLVIDGVEVTL